MNQSYYSLRLIILKACLLLMLPLLGLAQKKDLNPPTTLILNDLKDFKSPTTNWQIAGDVLVDFKKSKDLKPLSGTGILISQGNGKLISNFEHSDLELELEFLMPKDGQARIYLQGRYAIQLADSWLKNNPTYNDCGAVVPRLDNKLQKAYDGIAPLTNTSRAPGLWQTLTISFCGPKFNNKGEKIENARFAKVLLNNVIVQENVMVSGPAQNALLEDENVTGPIMIQSNQAPLAIRNIKYTQYGKKPLVLSNLQYSVYTGKFLDTPDFSKLKPIITATSNALTYKVTPTPDDFALLYTGNVQVSETGNYAFDFKCRGGGKFEIDGKTIINNSGNNYLQKQIDTTVLLKSGTYPFKFIYYRSQPKMNPQLYLNYQGPGIPRQSLNSDGAIFDAGLNGNITIPGSGSEVVLQRSFVYFRGKKKSYGMSVAEPTRVCYNLDLQQGALLNIWRGDFVDVTGMWNSRGINHDAKPMGAFLEISEKPTLAILPDNNAAWPDTMTSNLAYKFKGYELDKEKRPTFSYSMGGVDVQERFIASADGQKLNRQLKVSSVSAKNNVWCKLAEGKNITKLANGTYAINDKSYYLEVAKGSKPVIRKSNGLDELLLPIKLNGKQTEINYAIIW